MLIRTGGEQRLSNFLLWQAAYSELFFSDRLWPDFDETALDEAIAAYGQRARRFGMTPEQVEYKYQIGQERFMVNVGSVGQPRDGDPRSCYVIQEDDKITFHRVEYDWGVTADKIYRTPDLDNFLGDRIKEGR